MLEQEKRSVIQKEIKALQGMLDEDKDQRVNRSHMDISKMTKEEKIRVTWELPPLTDSLMNTIKETGFITGSSQFSEAVPNDIDWVVNFPPHVLEGYVIGMTDEDYWDSDGMSPLYAHYDGQLLNIICMGDYSLLKAWYMTTEVMKKLQYMEVPNNYNYPTEMNTPFSVVFNTKWKRVRVFRALVDILWSEKPLKEPHGLHWSVDHNVCMLCGREAVNFTSKPMRDRWQKTGICERCIG